jgi:hypothetical protein
MSETIQLTASRLEAFISQNYSNIETAPGSVINELLIKLAAAIQNEQYNRINDLDQGNSIKAILDSDTDSYSPIMDEIASNYNVVRGSGSKSAGKVKVVVSEISGYIFQQYSVAFTQPALNLNYVLTGAFRVSIDPSPVLQEIQLHEEDGLYYFILDVEAEDVGAEYQLNSGTPLALNNDGFITNFVRAEAYGNFSSGSPIETDRQLVDKIKYNLGNSRLESPAGIANKFRSTFPGFQYLSVCGANDPEMLRSKRNIMGISTFGKADVYVRSSLGIEFVRKLKTAKKTGETSWEMRISNEDIPGFYDIRSILPKVEGVLLGGTLVISSIRYGSAIYDNLRNNDLTQFDYNVLNPEAYSDARFTKYQTAVIDFEYEGLPEVAVGSSAYFEVTASAQPYLSEMQDMLLSDEYRLACADYLVKAVVPCMVSLKIKLVKKRSIDTFETLNLQKLKQDLFNYINTIPFGSELYASNIVDICHNYNIKRVDLPISMSGVILCPDNTKINLEHSDILSIPTDIHKGVTPKTTAYFIDYYRTQNGQTQAIDNIDLSIA